MEKIITLASILEVSCDYLLNDKIEKMTASKKQIEKNAVTRLLEKAKGRTMESLTVFGLIGFVLAFYALSKIEKLNGRVKKLEEYLVRVETVKSVAFLEEEKTC